jgi:hypothetical protein
MLKELIKFTVEIGICSLILIYIVAIILVRGNPEHWKYMLAHITGAGVQAALIVTFLYSCFNFGYSYRNKYSIYALCLLLLSIVLMLFGYVLYFFEGLSPSIHAQVNILFDFATILFAVSVLVDKIATKKYLKRLIK